MASAFEIEYADRSIYLPRTETLVVADLHVGRDATSDVELPMGEQSDIRSRLWAILESHDPERVVLAGDVLHSFGSIPHGVPETITTIRETIDEFDAGIVALRGNHDTMLESLLDEDVVRSSIVLEDGTVVHHGHEIPESKGDRYVIGHEHPTIEIEGDRHPCFLDGRAQYEGADVLVLPSFNRFVVGTPVNGMRTTDSMSPLLTNVSACRPVVRTSDETLRFPRLEALGSFL